MVRAFNDKMDAKSGSLRWNIEIWTDLLILLIIPFNSEINQICTVAACQSTSNYFIRKCSEIMDQQ